MAAYIYYFVILFCEIFNAAICNYGSNLVGKKFGINNNYGHMVNMQQNNMQKSTCCNSLLIICVWTDEMVIFCTNYSNLNEMCTQLCMHSCHLC